MLHITCVCMCVCTRQAAHPALSQPRRHLSGEFGRSCTATTSCPRDLAIASSRWKCRCGSRSLKTEVLVGDPCDSKAIKVLNRQITWKDGEIHWEADPRLVEILAAQLGMQDS